jgi:hypothetical protein
MKTFKDIRNMVESHYPTQGSSVEYPKYKEMDMDNLVKDAIGDIPEDDGPHTSDISDTPNFTTVANPENVINQSSSKGNREFAATVASRKSGKPFTSFRKKPMRYGVEDLSGAVASVAMGEAKEEDQGEYDYEGDMAKSQLRSIVRNANMLHDMLEDDTNLPEWVQSKITLAEDYIVTAAQYMQSQMNEEVAQFDEANLTPYRNTERGVQGTKRNGLPRVSNAKQFFRPPEGFTKKGVEKGKGTVIAVSVYKKKK